MLYTPAGSGQASSTSGAIVLPKGARPRRVLITPLSSTLPPSHEGTQSTTGSCPVKGQVVITPVNRCNQPPSTQDRRQGVSKLLLKAFCKGSKKDPKTFTLCDVPTAAISSCKQLKQEIRAELHEDIVRDFDVGYIQGSTPV